MTNEVTRKPPAQGMAEGLMRLLTDPAISSEKLELLLKMQQETLAAQAREDFHLAFNQLAAELPQVEKHGVVELRTRDDRRLGAYAYTRWEDMDRAIRPKLTQHGFGLSFSTHTDAQGVTMVRGKLLHAAGHAEEASLPLISDKGPGRNELQAMGSGLSYTKRYLAELLLNVVRKGEDDDGLAALRLNKLTPNQAAKLATMIADVGSTPEKFLGAMVTGVTKIEDVPARDYERLVNTLTVTKQRKGKK